MAKTISVNVKPNCKDASLTKVNDYYEARLSSPPINGKANKELIELIAREFKVAKSKIKVIKGFKSKVKTLTIDL